MRGRTRSAHLRNFFAEPVEKPTDSKAAWCFCAAPDVGAGMSSNLAPAGLYRGTGPLKQKEIINCSAKELNGIGLPNGWTVRIIYRDGSLPTTFTIEELKDIEEQIDLRSDWITISVNRYVPKPPSEPGSPVDVASAGAA
jgi:hypothetical protein